MVQKGEVKKEDCFLAHPDGDMSKFGYELDHGFKLNNTFFHGSQMKHESRLHGDKTVKCLAGNSDPRRTKSEPDLTKFLYSSDNNRENKEESDEYVVEPPAQDTYDRVVTKYQRPSLDDLSRLIDRRNIDLIHANKERDFNRLKEIVYKPDRDQEEFITKVTSTSRGQIVNLHREECDLMVREGLKYAKFEEQLEELVSPDLL